MTTIAIFPRKMTLNATVFEDKSMITLDAGHGTPIEVFLPPHVADALMRAWDDATAQDATPEPVFASVRRQEQLT